ncbi:Rv1733c family protein [Streptomyces iconiensis]|uniref:Proline rich protein membrane protein n=1 Tax=Streptomyces iconiensis TaxID=1384038 RepID=A0ABT6ZRZ6_9ACTN|nr:hypothetical protein [Streptomyces iconiensis]MDJ1131637.1 hypothetical protein [Streptomyces iconiensis]
MPDLVPHSQPPPRRLLPWRRRHNPLRRPTDRLESCLALTVALAVLVAAPAAMLLTASVAHRTYERTAHRQAEERHHVPATLLQASLRHPEPGSDEAGHTRYPTRVRYTAPAGRTRTATADVPGGLPSGATVDLWCDESGSLTAPPMRPDEIRNRTAGWSLTAGVVTVLTGFLAFTVARRRLERRNLASWGEDWATWGPRWTLPR